LLGGSVKRVLGRLLSELVRQRGDVGVVDLAVGHG
jgi:hypothetical protein